MPSAAFYCLSCKNPLKKNSASLTCCACSRAYPVVNGIPDFFLVDGPQEDIDEPSQTWLEAGIVEARNTIYDLSARQLKGMAFCMHEIARRTGAGVRVLEVGLGTGHFTAWLAELAAPGTEIYAFDFSWPILKTAQVNLSQAHAVTIFRANARGRLPFPDQYFDILFLRLAPLGPHGMPNVTAGAQLLKPGGWYFEACWERKPYEESWAAWAIQHGFEHAEQHIWHYPRTVSEAEEHARQVEWAAFPADFKVSSPVGVGNVRMTIENLVIAQKT